jgi:hypothetical protein
MRPSAKQLGWAPSSEGRSAISLMAIGVARSFFKHEVY